MWNGFVWFVYSPMVSYSVNGNGPSGSVRIGNILFDKRPSAFFFVDMG
jgi:hypothetical protein